MANLDKITEEIKSETVENEEQKVDNAPNQAEIEVEQDKEETDVETPKVDLNKISKEEKITHSFKQQLNKQRNKYESQLAAKNKEFEELKSRLDKLENPDKYKEKLRNDFENDDKYIDYLVEQRMNKILKTHDEENEKKRKLSEEQRKQTERINERIGRWFKTDEDKEKYVMTVQQAFDNGLEELIDKEQYVSNYLQQSEFGPRLLYELATNNELTKQVFSQADPMSRIMELKLFERELMKNTEQKKTSPIISTNKVIGKPGISSNSTTDIFSNTNDLKNFIRRR